MQVAVPEATSITTLLAVELFKRKPIAPKYPKIKGVPKYTQTKRNNTENNLRKFI